jgi:hypothetical protein
MLKKVETNNLPINHIFYQLDRYPIYFLDEDFLFQDLTAYHISV